MKPQEMRAKASSTSEQARFMPRLRVSAGFGKFVFLGAGRNAERLIRLWDVAVWMGRAVGGCGLLGRHAGSSGSCDSNHSSARS